MGREADRRARPWGCGEPVDTRFMLPCAGPDVAVGHWRIPLGGRPQTHCLPCTPSPSGDIWLPAALCPGDQHRKRASPGKTASPGGVRAGASQTLVGLGSAPLPAGSEAGGQGG